MGLRSIRIVRILAIYVFPLSFGGVRWVHERTIVPKWRVFESHVPLMRYRDRERRRRSERAGSRGETARRILLIETQEDRTLCAMVLRCNHDLSAPKMYSLTLSRVHEVVAIDPARTLLNRCFPLTLLLISNYTTEHSRKVFFFGCKKALGL